MYDVAYVRQAGQQYTAEVVRIMDYGAFVELAGCGGTQALLHISEMSHERVCHHPPATMCCPSGCLEFLTV